MLASEVRQHICLSQTACSLEILPSEVSRLLVVTMHTELLASLENCFRLRTGNGF